MVEHRSTGMSGLGQRSEGAIAAWWPMAAWLCVALAPTAAFAQQNDLAIEWDAPATCPALGDVRGMLDAVIPAEVRERLEGTHVAVRLAANGSGYRADIVVARGTFVGERSLEGRRCEDVARSAIVVISVALTEAVEAAAAPTPEPVPELDPIPEPDPDPEPAPDANPLPIPVPHDDATHVEAGLSAVTGLGSAFAAPRIEAAVRRELGAHVQLGARFRAVPFARVDDANARVGHLAALTVAPEACVVASPRQSLHIGGCASLELGFMHARGDSSIGGSRGNAGYVSLDVLPMLEVGRRLRLRITLGLETRFVRPQLGIRGSGTVASTPVVAGSAGLALVFVIP